MTKTNNRFGLSRTIPALTKQSIRKECGYGCMICGNSIYQYEHIIPEFKDAKSHDVDKIGLLCAGCHNKVTMGYLPKEHIQEVRKNPYCIEHQSSFNSYHITPDTDITIELGKSKFINTRNVIVIDGCSILTIIPPEEEKAPPLLNAKFYDRNGNKIAWIDNNEWFGGIGSFDIEARRTSIIIKSNLHNIDLEINVLHPNIFQILKLNLNYNGKQVCGNIEEGFKFKTSRSIVSIGEAESVYKNGNFGISIQGESIIIGQNNIVNFTNRKGEVQSLDGSFEVYGGELDVQNGKNGFRFKSDAIGGGVKLKINFPKSQLPKINISFEKQLLNDLCNCGSQKKYGTCCLENKKQLNLLVNQPVVIRTFQDFTASNPDTVIHFKFYFRQDYSQAWLFLQDNPIIVINTVNKFSESNIGFNLLLLNHIKNGYIFKIKLYEDFRNEIIYSLQSFLLSISIIESMKTEDYDMTKYCEEEFSVIESKMKEKILNNKDFVISERPIYESIKYLRLHYNLDYLSKERLSSLLELFRQKAPVAVQIGDQLLRIIKSNNVFTKNGYNDCLYKCISHLDDITNGQFRKIKVELQSERTKPRGPSPFIVSRWH